MINNKEKTIMSNENESKEQMYTDGKLNQEVYQRELDKAVKEGIATPITWKDNKVVRK